MRLTSAFIAAIMSWWQETEYFQLDCRNYFPSVGCYSWTPVGSWNKAFGLFCFLCCVCSRIRLKVENWLLEWVLVDGLRRDPHCFGLQFFVFWFFDLEIKEKILPVLVGPPESGGSASPPGFSRNKVFLCLFICCFQRWDQQVSRLKKKSRDLTAGSGWLLHSVDGPR